MITRVEKVLFFATIFSIILQTGKHFWPSFAYVDALRIDYLSPTLYISDICIGTLFILFSFSWFHKKRKKISHSPILGVVVLLLVMTTVFAFNQAEALYGSFKVLEFVFFAYFVSERFKRSDVKPLVYTFLAASCIESGLAIWQFAAQHSIGGLWYFLGERTFDASTIGIATFPVRGREILRPYGTFPHPNVLGFFLLMAFCFLLYYISYEKEYRYRALIGIGGFLAFIAILLSFSRIIYVSFAIAIVIFLKSHKRSVGRAGIAYFMGLIVTVLILSEVLLGRVFNFSLLGRDLFYREELIGVATKIIQKNPLVGVGLNNFYFYEAHFQTSISPIFLQPVHNIYILLLSELGIFGLGIFVYFLIKTLQNFIRTKKVVKGKKENDFYRGIAYLLLSALFIGFFDHFFFTLQQGQMMIALLFGLVWVKK